MQGLNHQGFSHKKAFGLFRGASIQTRCISAVPGCLLLWALSPAPAQELLGGTAPVTRQGAPRGSGSNSEMTWTVTEVGRQSLHNVRGWVFVTVSLALLPPCPRHRSSPARL